MMEKSKRAPRSPCCGSEAHQPLVKKGLVKESLWGGRAGRPGCLRLCGVMALWENDPLSDQVSLESS